MTTLVVLKDVLTDANAIEVLARAEWKSKEEVEAIAAELAPKPAPVDDPKTAGCNRTKR